MSEEMKTCIKCSETKPLSMFIQDSRKKDGHRSDCKKCSNEYLRMYYTLNREKILARQRARYATNREQGQARSRAYYAANKAERVAYGQAYRAEHGEEVRVRARARWATLTDKQRAQTVDWQLQNRFGISLADYGELLDAQGGGCAICGMTPEDNGRRLAVDHDHKTNKIRGLLCIGCNQALGLFGDSAKVLHQAALYLGYGKDSVFQATYEVVE